MVAAVRRLLTVAYCANDWATVPSCARTTVNWSLTRLVHFIISIWPLRRSSTVTVNQVDPSPAGCGNLTPWPSVTRTVVSAGAIGICSSEVALLAKIIGTVMA
jgi:hypothetical protein